MSLCFAPVAECKNIESYGQICVECGKCGRFDTEYECVNCGYKSNKRTLSYYKDWGIIEFYNGWFPICPNCKPLFREEDQTQVKPWYSNKVIACRREYFKSRTLAGQELPGRDR